MKEFKTKVLNEMISLSNEQHAVKIKTAANNVGVKHLKTQEVKEILDAYTKEKHDFKIYQLADNPLDSLFVSAFVSDNESIPY
jgi:hypothetical protein